MQVTGSKDNKNNPTRLSIRIPSGQSLHWDSGSQLEGVTAIELCFEGWEVIPYPKALGEELNLSSLLATSGIALQRGDMAVGIEGEGNVNYALRLSAESVTALEEVRQRGLSVTLTTPLARCVCRAIVGSRRPKTVVLTLLDDTAYVAYTLDKHLEYAEALPTRGEEEVVNLLAHLNQDYDLRKARFVLLGKQSAEYYKTLRKYFRRVRVEI